MELGTLPSHTIKGLNSNFLAKFSSEYLLDYPPDSTILTRLRLLARVVRIFIGGNELFQAELGGEVCWNDPE